MRVEVLVPLLDLAGTLAMVASARRRPSASPDSSRCTWGTPDPIPGDVVRRAKEIQALGAPLGTEYVEELGGRVYKFRRKLHGPNQEIPYWHPGVGVRLCDAARSEALAE